MKHSIVLTGVLVAAALVAITWANTSVEASGNEISRTDAPQYSEICAHGHNGFSCGVSSLRADIDMLEERVTALEERP